MRVPRFLFFTALFLLSPPGVFAQTEGSSLVYEVLVIGAGPAGLRAADILRENGISHVVLEASSRAGGLVLSRPDESGMDLVLEDGANLVNSIDEEVLSLVERFGLRLSKRLNPGEDAVKYIMNGRLYSQKELNEKLFSDPVQQRALWNIANDMRKRELKDSPQWEFGLQHRTVRSYLEGSGIHRDLTALIASFFWSEYGKTIDEVNVHVLFDYLKVDLEEKTLEFIPNFDEAYTLPDGLSQITDALLNLNRDDVLLDHKVMSVEADPQGVRIVKARVGDDIKVFRANHIEYAAPLHALKEIRVKVPDFSEQTVEEARRASYGSGKKFHLKFKPGFREVYSFNGTVMTDTGEQIWVASRDQKGSAGLVTVLTGPLEASQHEEAVRRSIAKMELITPGISRFFIGFEVSTVPQSYSGPYKPGEPRDLVINRDHSHWLTINESAGGYFQGYLEGAFRRARTATDSLVNKILGSASARDCGSLLAQ